MPDLTVVIPTFNEAGNLRPLMARLEEVLESLCWEAIIVDDDSPDGTADEARQMAQSDPKIRVIQRIGRRGLSSACVEGFLASSSPFLAVLDADMQHDESLLPQMLKALSTSSLDIVIGSRYMDGGSTGELAEHRAVVSQFASFLGEVTTKVSVTDPMSWFFMLKRSFFEKHHHRLSGIGFKILLDLLSSAKGEVSYEEMPYVMRSRKHGASKLDSMVIWEYLLLLLDKSVGAWIPVRFILFIMVGASGILVHLAALYGSNTLLVLPFSLSQVLATWVAMTSNFTFNNWFTYRDQRLVGWSFFRGLLLFYLACAVGAIINVAVADQLYQLSVPWWFAGTLGAAIGAIWNYGASHKLSWGNQ